ncbi:MAG TPA: hypothetical protein VMB51_09175 [Solirubrobacteraceae bacterium]|nr:hypothetical protein [Solirubrobacteraceae bacterium]
MHEGIQINRMADRFSSHTLAHARPAGCGTSGDKVAVRERLIAAAVEVLAQDSDGFFGGSDPRLDKTLVLA